MLERYTDYIYHCLKCGACRIAYQTYEEICPSGLRFGFDSYYAIGRIEIARAILEEKLKITTKTAHRILTCTSCGACNEQCNPAMGLKPLEVIEELKRMVVESGFVPSKVRVFLENVVKFGNPYGEARSRRGVWAGEVGVRHIKPGDDFLLFIGCVSSYDSRAQEVAKALSRVLLVSGFSFGILGEEEVCDGNEVYRLGETELFKLLAEKNIENFKKYGVKKIVTLSPHSYNAIKNEYPKFGGNFEVYHYTQILKDLIKKGKIDVSKGLKAKVKVTYHDPCFLGRWNNEYEAARYILTNIPGIELIEMERSKENSFCCGGGSGNFYTDLLGGTPNSPNRVRIKEAQETGANILATACPICTIMLEDAAKTEELEQKIQIKDLAEIIKQTLQP